MNSKNISNKHNKNKILLISYHFPPSAAVGGLRIANFAKNLKLFGWTTYVLTRKDHYHKALDYERLEDLKAIKVYKTIQLLNIRDFYLRLKTIWHSVLRRRIVTLNELNNSYVPNSANPLATEKTSQKLKRYFVSLFLAIPDTERNWVLPAVFKAIRVIKSNKIDFILTSCPPYSVHLIGLLVKIMTGVKWIADFRDPWMISGSKKLYPTCTLSLKIEGWLEKQVVKRADMVLTTTENLCSAFSKLYNKEPKNKFLCITNGFDKEIFTKIDNLRKYKKFTLSYTGALYLGRTPEPVFKALKELALEDRLNLQNIKVKLVGNCQYINGHPIDQMIRSYNLDSVVEVLDPVPYLRSLEIVKQSHLALLFAPDQPFQIPAKIFDYIGAETKILTIAEKGATSDLIKSTKVGKSFNPSDIDGIKEYIYQSINDAEAKKPESNLDILHQFDRRVIINNFADHLKSIIP